MLFGIDKVFIEFAGSSITNLSTKNRVQRDRNADTTSFVFRLFVCVRESTNIY